MPKAEITYKPVGVNEKATHGDYKHLCQMWEGLTPGTAKVWALVNELDDRAESKKKNRQLIASDIARMNLRNSDKQFTYDVDPPIGLK